jgi:eukaryotic-like serine/threonine-protein kinase
MNELAGQCLGGYELEEEIGRGSMGVVYRGKQIALGREVAVKVLPQSLAKDVSYVARFIREAQITAGLNHPNIVQIYDAGQQNKLLYFVMEYVQGPTLASLLHLDTTIPQYLAAEYTAQIGDALDAAYRERHVIHRDIKPENLMLDRWGRIKVMDFGLARAIGLQKITVAKTLVGSLYYASPEQVWGQELDNRSDIYALGVVLYEMVTGQRPFKGRSLAELTHAITNGSLRPPTALNAEIVPELEAIILRAMARDRNRRYSEAMQMAQELRALHLQAPPLTSGAGYSSSPAPGPLGGIHSPLRPHGREPIVIHPPKRPQAQRPHYIDGDTVFSPEREVLVPQQTQAAATPLSPLSASEVSQPTTPTIDTEGPTGPLPSQETEQKNSNIKGVEAVDKDNRRSIWQRWQRMFSKE